MPRIVPPAKEGGQPTTGVGLIDKVVEVFPNMPSCILAKRKHDDGVGVLGYKKSRAPSSLRAMREAVELMFDSGHSSSFQGSP